MADARVELARLGALHRDCRLHTTLVALALLWLEIAESDVPGPLGLSVCASCHLAYAAALWPPGGDRVSVSHGICPACFAAQAEDFGVREEMRR